MQRVQNADKKRWGHYEDRNSSFDDDQDIYRFIDLANEYESLQTFLKSYVGDDDFHWVEKPDGDYGVDFSLFKEDVRVANFDVERWSQWKNDWPNFYKKIHFLDRKEKFLNSNVPFFMCFFSFDRKRVLIVDEQTINKYPSKEKRFRNQEVYDMVKEIPLRAGYIFGDYTRVEKNTFKVI